MKDFFELRENKIFFVKVGDGRDSMTVKTKAPNSREALKKVRGEYPKTRVSLDQNQKQGQNAGMFESADRTPTAAEIKKKQDFLDRLRGKPPVKKESSVEYGKSVDRIRDKQKNAAIKPKDRETLGKLADLMKKQRRNEAYRKPTQAEIDADKRKDGKSKDSSTRYRDMKKKMYGNAMGKLKEEEVSEISQATKQRYTDKVVKKLTTKRGSRDHDAYTGRTYTGRETGDMFHRGAKLDKHLQRVKKLDTKINVPEENLHGLKNEGLNENMVQHPDHHKDYSSSDNRIGYHSGKLGKQPATLNQKQISQHSKAASDHDAAAKRHSDMAKRSRSSSAKYAHNAASRAHTAASIAHTDTIDHAKRGKLVRGHINNTYRMTANANDHTSEAPKSRKKMSESTTEQKMYSVKYTHPTDKKSGRTTGPMSKAAADKKAAMGNRVDKVGGKYTVIRHVGESIDEATMADRRVLKAVRIAKDMAGNHTGATRAIEKLKKGLSNHPKVRDALRTHNESVRIDLEESVISTIKRIIGMVKNPKATKAAFKLYRDAWDDVVVGALKQPDMDSAVNKIDKAAIILAGIKKGEPVNSNPEYRRRKSRMLKGLADQMAKKGQEADAKKIRTLAKMSESVRSADKKPENYRDPETGRTMTRMVPVNRDIVAKKANESDDKGRKDPYRPGAVGKDAQKRAHKSFQDVRQMASDMIRKKNMKESVELEERTNSVKYSRKDFENTKKGDKLEIKWGDSISSGRSATFVVAGKSASKKYNVEKLRLEPEGKKGGVKFFLRSRNGGDATFSIGDMAAIMTSIKKV